MARGNGRLHIVPDDDDRRNGMEVLGTNGRCSWLEAILARSDLQLLPFREQFARHVKWRRGSFTLDWPRGSTEAVVPAGSAAGKDAGG